MPIYILLLLIIGLSLAAYLLLRPLRVLSRREWIISHAVMVIGLALVLGWIWLNREKYAEATMLMGGIWTLSGGICFLITYLSRRLKKG